jgi:hypothetical protein
MVIGKNLNHSNSDFSLIPFRAILPTFIKRMTFPLRRPSQGVIYKAALWFESVPQTMLTLIPSTPKPRRSARIWSGGLVLLLLISSLILPYHHHNDSASHSDCPICISVNLPFLVNNNDVLNQCLFQGIDFNSPETIIPVSKLFIVPQAPRAPPAI